MRSGRYSELLRVVGRLLDEREALVRAETSEAGLHGGTARGEDAYHDIEIVDHGAFVRLSWRTRGGCASQRAYTDLALSLLHARSLQLRGEPALDPAGEREELLRTLGQELDAEELQVSGIFQKEDEFFVSGSASGRYFNRSYTGDELRALSDYRQLLRQNRGEDEQPPTVADPGSPGARSRWLLWGD